MYKIAVIGDKDSVLAFRALGVHVFTAIEGNDARRIIDKLAKEGYGIIYITEALAAECKNVIEKYQERILPAIIQIPGVSGNTGDGVQGVKNSVEQAVGSDILFSNN